MNSSHEYTSAPGHLLPGRWFDGRSSQARPVLVGMQPTARGPSLHLHPLSAPGAAPVVFAHQDVGWPEAWNARRPQARVVVDLRDQGSLEIDAVSAWHAALAAAGARPGLAQRMQTRWSVLLAVLLIAGAGVWAFYRWGTPWAATQITRHVPLAWELALTEQAMKQIDADYVKPSKLPPERQAELRAGFDKLVALIGPDLQRYRGYRPPFKLEFRSGMGPNAFALPGGDIVVTTGMLRLVKTPEELLGTIAHEVAHVTQKHHTRTVVASATPNGIMKHRLATLIAI